MLTEELLRRETMLGMPVVLLAGVQFGPAAFAGTAAVAEVNTRAVWFDPEARLSWLHCGGGTVVRRERGRGTMNSGTVERGLYTWSVPSSDMDGLF